MAITARIGTAGATAISQASGPAGLQRSKAYDAPNTVAT